MLAKRAFRGVCTHPASSCALHERAQANRITAHAASCFTASRRQERCGSETQTESGPVGDLHLDDDRLLRPVFLEPKRSPSVSISSTPSLEQTVKGYISARAPLVYYSIWRCREERSRERARRTCVQRPGRATTRWTCPLTTPPAPLPIRKGAGV